RPEASSRGVRDCDARASRTGGAAAPRHPRGNGEDEADAGSGATSGGVGMTWHADPALMETYALGVLDEAHASSIEAHLVRCEPCRTAIARHVGRSRLDEVWAAIDERVE